MPSKLVLVHYYHVHYHQGLNLLTYLKFNKKYCQLLVGKFPFNWFNVKLFTIGFEAKCCTFSINFSDFSYLKCCYFNYGSESKTQHLKLLKKLSFFLFFITKTNNIDCIHSNVRYPMLVNYES